MTCSLLQRGKIDRESRVTSLIPLSHFFVKSNPNPTLLSSLSRIPFFPKILGNLDRSPCVAVKSRTLSTNLTFSHIPLCILVKSRGIPRIPSQTLWKKKKNVESKTVESQADHLNCSRHRDVTRDMWFHTFAAFRNTRTWLDSSYRYFIKHRILHLYVLVGRVSFKRLKTPQKRGTRHYKHTVSYLYSLFLHYINIWDQKVRNFVFYEAFLPIIWIKLNASVTKMTVNVWHHMSRVTLRCLQQFEWYACGRMKSESNDNNDSFWGTGPSKHNNRGSSNLFHSPFLLWVLECFCFCSYDLIHKNY